MKKNKSKSNSVSINLSLAILGILAIGLVASLVFSLIPKAAEAASYQPYTPPVNRTERAEESTQNPVPTISGLDPESANASGGSINITVTGNGFVPSTQARWNGSNRQTTFIDRSHLLVELRSGDLLGSSGRYISVFNPGPGGGYSNAALFEIKGAAAGGYSNYVAPGVSTEPSVNPAPETQTGEVMGENVAEPAEDKSFNTLASNALYGSEVGLRPSGLTQWLIFAILVLLVIIVVRKLYLENKYHSTPLKHA